MPPPESPSVARSLQLACACCALAVLVAASAVPSRAGDEDADEPAQRAATTLRGEAPPTDVDPVAAPPTAGLASGTVRPGEIIVELTDAAALGAPGAGRGGFAQLGGAGASLDALLSRHRAGALQRVFRSFEDASGRLVDTTRARVARARAARSARGAGAGSAAAPVDVPALENFFLLEVEDAPTGAELDALVAELEASPLVVRAQPNYVYTILAEPLPAAGWVPNDPFVSTDGQTWSEGAFGNAFPDLYGVRNTRALEAFGLMDTDGSGAFEPDEVRPGEGVVVAIIDTGLDMLHPDIVANVWVNDGEIPGDGVDNDGNGFVDDVHGWDFAYGDADPADGHGHGSHVSGTAAAVANNAEGIVGLAPFARIMPVKGLDDGGSGASSRLAAAIHYASANGADITSNSWGGFVGDPIVAAAFDVAEASGVLSFAAAGNDGQPRLSQPALLPNVFSVAAVDHTDRLASFTNRATDLDLCAPGVRVWSLDADTAGYVAFNGTSMATPHVAGAAATLMSLHPSEAPSEIRGRLLGGAASIAAENPGYELEIGAGRLDLLGSALATPTPLFRIGHLSSTPLVRGRTVARIDIELENAWAGAQDVDAYLMPGDTRNARIVTRRVGYGDLASGERKTGVFEVVPRPGIAPGEPIHLQLLVRAAPDVSQLFDLRLSADYFEDVSEDAAVQPSPFVAAGAAFADYDNDGLTDFVVSAPLGALILHHNEGDGTFVRRPLRSVTGKRPVFLDLDGDGDLDLIGAADGSSLHENDGSGGFSRVLGTPFDALTTSSLVPLDLDADGDLDIISVRPSFYTPPGSNVYRAVDVLRNDGGLAFSSIWEATGMPASIGARQLVMLDYDDDGLVDLFSARAGTRQGRLYRNVGGTFVEVSSASFPGNALACGDDCEIIHGAAAGDYDNDGDVDLVTVGDTLQDPQNRVFHFFRNDGSGVFADVTDETLVGSVSAMMGLWAAEFFDLDNDGDLDLIVPYNGILAGGAGAVLSPTNVVLENLGDGTFAPLSDRAFPIDTPLASFVTVLGDFDDDGGIDVFGAAGTTIIETGGLLRNVGAARNHWLEVELVPTASAPGAYGARIVAETFTGVQRRDVHYGPMDASLVHFGLGRHRFVRSLEIRWPSGAVQRLTRIAADQRIRIVEP